MATNYAGNIMMGTGTGAAAGGAAAGPYGALAGAILGAAGGLFASIAEEKDANRRRDMLEEASRRVGIGYDQMLREYQDWYSTHQPAGKVEDAELAADMIRGWDSSKYDWMGSLDANGDGVISREEYNMDYDKDVDYFLNPYMDKIIDDVSKQMRGTAGGALTGRSTDAQAAMTRSAVEKEDEIYKTALQAYENDRDWAYKQWADYNTAMQNRLNGLMQADQWQIGQLQGLGQDALNWQAQAFQNAQDIKQNKINTQAQLDAAAAQI